MHATGSAATKRHLSASTAVNNDNPAPAVATAPQSDKKTNGQSTSQAPAAPGRENTAEATTSAAATTTTTLVAGTATPTSSTMTTSTAVSIQRVDHSCVGVSRVVKVELTSSESREMMAVGETINNNNNNECLLIQESSKTLSSQYNNNDGGEDKKKLTIARNDNSNNMIGEIGGSKLDSCHHHHHHPSDVDKRESSKPVPAKYNLPNGDVRIHITPIRINDNNKTVTEKLNGGMTSPAANNKMINKIDRKDIIASN